MPQGNSNNVQPIYSYSYTNGNGHYIDVVINDGFTSLPLLPDGTVQVLGFSVTVNGRNRNVLSALRLNPEHTNYPLLFSGKSAGMISGKLLTAGNQYTVYRIILDFPVYINDIINISYSGNQIQDTSTAQNKLQPFNNQGVYNNLTHVPFLFDPIDWLNGNSNFATGDIYERRNGFPSASILLDTAPPIGEVLLNESFASSGLSIHHFSVYGSPSVNASPAKDILMSNALEAMLVNSIEEQNIGSIVVLLKAVSDGTGGSGGVNSPIFNNVNDYISAHIYSETNGLPGVELVASSSNINYSVLTAGYTSCSFNISFDILPSTNYWIVLTQSNTPSGGTIYVQGYNTGISTHAISPDGILWKAINNEDCNLKLYGVGVNYSVLPGVNVTEDVFGNVISQSYNFGGTSNISEYESIGYGDKRSLVKLYRSPYPSVNFIEFCVTSIISKAYVIEVQVANGSWTPILYMIANDQTKDYFRYQFAGNVTLSAVRIHYRGDYYTTLNDGTLTVSAQDSLTGVAAVQMSHFPDFRDATDFPNTDSNGWLPFSDGSSLYNWKMVNDLRTWQSLYSPLNESIVHLISLQTTMFAVSHSNIYLFSPVTPPNLVYHVPNGATITSFAKFNNAYYFGTSDGYLFYTSAGNSFTILNPTSPITLIGDSNNTHVPITSMASLGGKLYFGTSAFSGGQAAVYSYDPALMTITLARQFQQRYINTMIVANGVLFVGLGGDLDSNAGNVYMYDGKTWGLSFSPISDSVDILFYSKADGKLWAGLRGGLLFALSFSSSGSAQTWVQMFSGDAVTYTSMANDSKNKLLWITAANGISAYVASQNRFITVIEPVIANQPSPVLNDIEYLGNSCYGAATNGNIYQFTISDITSKTRTVYARFMDNAGNTTPLPGVTDNIIQSSPTVNGVYVSNGNLYQIRTDKSVAATFSPSPPTSSLYAADRTLTEQGTYESEPFYAATLARWNNISILNILPAGTPSSSGLEQGTQIDLYIRTGDTREDCLAADWGNAFSTTTINNPSNASSGSTTTFSIATINGKWLQYKVVLITASKGSSPIVQGITLTYTASQASYFFSTMFTTDAYSNSPVPPQYKRGLLVANMIENGGEILFGYTIDDTVGNTFDFSQYKSISPNEIFELPTPSNKIRFGILIVSLNSSTPAIVDEYAAVLDTGAYDIQFMKNA